MTTAHSDSTANHPPENWVYANNTERDAATGFVAADIGKWAYVEATGLYHRLNAVDGSGNPTWSAGVGAGSVVYTETFTIGAEAGNVINVAAQLTVNGVNPAVRYDLRFWLSTSQNGAATAVDTSLAIGTNGVLVETHTALASGRVLTNATGNFDLNVGHGAAGTYYLHVALPDGTVAVSGAITFA